MNGFAKNAVTSWQTTVGGVLAWVVTVGAQLQTLFDADALTNPDWNLIVAATALLYAALSAKDAGKSTEDHR